MGRGVGFEISGEEENFALSEMLRGGGGVFFFKIARLAAFHLYYDYSRRMGQSQIGQ